MPDQDEKTPKAADAPYMMRFNKPLGPEKGPSDLTDAHIAHPLAGGGVPGESHGVREVWGHFMPHILMHNLGGLGGRVLLLPESLKVSLPWIPKPHPHDMENYGCHD